MITFAKCYDFELFETYSNKLQKIRLRFYIRHSSNRKYFPKPGLYQEGSDLLTTMSLSKIALAAIVISVFPILANAGSCKVNLPSPSLAEQVAGIINGCNEIPQELDWKSKEDIPDSACEKKYCPACIINIRPYCEPSPFFNLCKGFQMEVKGEVGIDVSFFKVIFEMS